MTRKWIIYISVIIIITIVILTKPDDRTIKIDTIKAVWGNLAPVPEKSPRLYEEFMNTTTLDIFIDDWWLLKRIRYQFAKGKETIGFAAIGKVFITR